MVIIKNKTQIAHIKVAGNIIAQIFATIEDILEEGITTADIDSYIHAMIIKEGGRPAFIGYHGYEFATCISVNEAVIHGIPSKNIVIHAQDLVSIDIGVAYQEGIADSAYTFFVGDTPNKEAQLLIDVTKHALLQGIREMVPGNYLHDISRAIEAEAKKHNLGIVKEYCGHGVGVKLHEAPEIPNFFVKSNNNIKLKEGMVFAIEPMFTLGTGDITHLSDNFTVVSTDNTLAAHFEHTVLITDTDHTILTL